MGGASFLYANKLKQDVEQINLKTKIKMSPNGMYARDLKDVIDYARNSDKTEEEYFAIKITWKMGYWSNWIIN